MTLTEQFEKQWKAITKDTLDEWSLYLQDRSRFEVCEETVRVFSRKISRRADSMFQKYTPDTIDGIVSDDSVSIQVNEFLRTLCRDLEDALRIYKPATDPIAEYLNNQKAGHIVNWLRQTTESSRKMGFMPEARHLDDLALTMLLAKYWGLQNALKTIKDENSSKPESSKIDVMASSTAWIAQKNRQQVVLAILLLRFEHGVHVTTRDEQREPERKKVGFNQERLAEVLAVIDGTNNVSKYKNCIREVLDMYKKHGSKRLLEGAKTLVDYICGIKGTDLAEFIAAEIEELDMDGFH